MTKLQLMTMNLGIHSTKTFSPVPDTMGIGNKDILFPERTFLNITNIAGWIPGVGIITAIAKLIHANTLEENITQHGIKDYITGLRIRAVFEAIGFGPILFIIDMIAILGRAIASEKKPAHH